MMRAVMLLMIIVGGLGLIGSCSGSSPSTSARPTVQETSATADTTDEDDSPPPEEEEPADKPPLKARFSDKRNTYAGVDGSNKTWEGGWDLKPGTYKTVDTFEPEYTPPNICRAWSSVGDDLGGQVTYDMKYHGVLKIHDGDEVTSVGCGIWKRVS